jgi:hypothetical protein
MQACSNFALACAFAFDHFALCFSAAVPYQSLSRLSYISPDWPLPASSSILL